MIVRGVGSIQSDIQGCMDGGGDPGACGAAALLNMPASSASSSSSLATFLPIGLGLLVFFLLVSGGRR